MRCIRLFSSDYNNFKSDSSHYSDDSYYSGDCDYSDYSDQYYYKVNSQSEVTSK
jgi:hypothetical protein